MPGEDLKRAFPKKPRQVLRFNLPVPPTQNQAFYKGHRGIKPHAKLWMRNANAYILKVIEDAG